MIISIYFNGTFAKNSTSVIVYSGRDDLGKGEPSIEIKKCS